MFSITFLGLLVFSMAQELLWNWHNKLQHVWFGVVHITKYSVHFVCVQIVTIGSKLYSYRFFIDFNGFMRCMAIKFIIAIFCIHHVFHVWWLKDWSTTLEFMNHAIEPPVWNFEEDGQRFPKCPWSNSLDYFPWIHEDFLEITSYGTPFILACWIVLKVLWTTCFYDSVWNVLPLVHCNFKLFLTIHLIYDYDVSLFLGCDQS